MQPIAHGRQDLGRYLKPVRFRPAGRPIQKLHRMDNGDIDGGGELRQTADIARGDNLAARGLQVGHFSVAKPIGDFGLHDVVGSGRPAAKMFFLYRSDLESRQGQKRFGFCFQPLAMLHGTGGMIGYHGAGFLGYIPQAKFHRDLGDILGERRNPRRFFRVVRIV